MWDLVKNKFARVEDFGYKVSICLYAILRSRCLQATPGNASAYFPCGDSAAKPGPEKKVTGKGPTQSLNVDQFGSWHGEVDRTFGSEIQSWSEIQ